MIVDGVIQVESCAACRKLIRLLFEKEITGDRVNMEGQLERLIAETFDTPSHKSEGAA